MNAALDLLSLRSALFVPLADDRFIAKAHARGADAPLLDLEDSVPPAYKREARARLAKEIIAAYEAAAREGRGALSLHGRMIDAPVVDQARAMLARVR